MHAHTEMSYVLACCTLQWWKYTSPGTTSRDNMGGAQALRHAHKELIYKAAHKGRTGFLAYHHIHNLSPKDMTEDQKQVQWGCGSVRPSWLGY